MLSLCLSSLLLSSLLLSSFCLQRTRNLHPTVAPDAVRSAQAPLCATLSDVETSYEPTILWATSVSVSPAAPVQRVNNRGFCLFTSATVFA